MEIADNLLINGDLTAGNVTISGNVSSTGPGTLLGGLGGNVAVTGNTTLTPITGLSVNLIAGASYNLRVRIHGNSTAGGGVKLAFGGNATATALDVTTWNYNGTTINAVTNITALASSLTAATAVYSDIISEGSIVVNAAGTLTVQGAQNVSNGNTTNFYANGCYLELARVS